MLVQSQVSRQSLVAGWQQQQCTTSGLRDGQKNYVRMSMAPSSPHLLSLKERLKNKLMAKTNDVTNGPTLKRLRKGLRPCPAQPQQNYPLPCDRRVPPDWMT